MITPSPHDQYIVERLDRVEREIEHHRTVIAALVTKGEVTDTLLSGIKDTLKEIKDQITKTQSTISRVGWLFLAPVAGAIVLFIAKGGLALVQ